MKAVTSSPKISSQTKAQQWTNLRAKCQEACAALAAAEQNDVLARHKVGGIVRDVMDEGKYGENAVGRMEKNLKLDQQTLRKYSTVAKAWSAAEFKTMATVRNAKGIPLTWSHYEEIATVKDGKARKNLIRRARKECLTVARLREIIAADKPVGRKHVGGTKKVEAPLVAIGHLARTLDVVDQEVLGWEQKVVPSLMASREKLSDLELSDLRNARERMEKTIAVLLKLAGQILEVVEPSAVAAELSGRIVDAGPDAQVAASAA